jgi:cell division protein FtsB
MTNDQARLVARIPGQEYRARIVLLLCALASTILIGCSPAPESSADNSPQQEEVARLQQENQALPAARSENEELHRLKTENQELPKLRSQYQEMGRLKKENEQLAAQLAKLRPRGAAPQSATGVDGQPGAGAAVAASHAPSGPEQEAEPVGEREILEEDEIWIEPQDLKIILPQFDWDKMQRTEPITVRNLLEKDGVVITNTAQLREMGLTNFVIKRPPQPAASESQPPPPPP